MCYYDHHVWMCRDWKWGNFRQHCQKEYRMGETCGMKMVFQSHPLYEECNLCKKIHAKERRMAKHREDYARWARDPENRYIRSMERAVEEMKQIAYEIQQLRIQKAERYNAIGNNRR